MIEKFLKPIFKKNISKEKSSEENTSRFVLEKLDRGFGHTIGVAMRRTLLSAIPGASIFAIEIDGVNHEFTSIKDVKEDAVELILNIKKLILSIDEKVYDEEKGFFELKLVSSEGVIKAKDLQCPTEIKIVNPNLVIANTSKNKALVMTLYGTYSKGYKTFEENRTLIKEKLGEKKGLISIDSSYSPVVKVNTIIEEVNPGETRVFERLILDVTTNGSLSPEKAVAYAGAILKNNYIAFEEMVEVDMDKNFVEEKIEIEENTELSQTIESFNLSERSTNALKMAKIDTLEQLINLSISELKSVKNLGEKSITEIVQLVQEMGLSFKSE